jgi:hypothetical protein
VSEVGVGSMIFRIIAILPTAPHGIENAEGKCIYSGGSSSA